MPIDYKKYPPNWKTEMVPFVLNRAQNCCESCGLENRSKVYRIKVWIKSDGRYTFESIWFRNEQDAIREARDYDVKMVTVVLTVAHLDHDELNHDVAMDRLKALCQVCHLRYDAKEKFRRTHKRKEVHSV